VASVLQHCRVARQSLRSGNRAEALALAREIVKQQPHCLLALRLLALLSLDAGTREALSAFQQCAAIDPQDPLAEVGLAMICEDAGVVESAIRHYRRAAELSPDDPRVEDELARLGVMAVPPTALGEGIRALRVQDTARAIPELQAALSEQPADPAAKLALAQALWLEQATDQATALASQVLATHPHSIVALMILLASELRRGRALRVRELQARIDAIEPGLVLHPEVASLLGLPVGK